MPTTNDLKKQLQKIAQNNFSIPENIDPFSFALEMMDQIGSPDSELRDDLIYTALATWILKRNVFNCEQMRQLLFISLDGQHILYSIGEINTDSVFTRSFSVLLLPLVLITHRERPFLTKTEIQQIKEMLIKYLYEEQDLRGYVVGRGWAHAVAHVGDAFDDLAQCWEMETSDLLDILNSIADKMCFDGFPFINDEDERMTTAVISILNRQLLNDSEIEKWIKRQVVLAQETRQIPTSYRLFNFKNFLRSLYFRMYQKNISIPPNVYDALHEISRYDD